MDILDELNKRLQWIGQTLEGWKIIWASTGNQRETIAISVWAWFQLEGKRLWMLFNPRSLSRMPAILWILFCVTVTYVRGFSPFDLLSFGDNAWWTVFITLVSLGWVGLFCGFLQAKASYPMRGLQDPIGGNKSLGMYLIGALVWIAFGLAGSWFPLWVILAFVQFVPLFMGTVLQNQSVTLGYLAFNSCLALAGWWYVIAK